MGRLDVVETGNPSWVSDPTGNSIFCGENVRVLFRASESNPWMEGVWCCLMLAVTMSTSFSIFSQQHCEVITSSCFFCVCVWVWEGRVLKKKFFFFSFYGHTWKFPGSGLNWSCRCRPTPQPQQRWIQTASAPYTTPCGHAVSLTHWARPGVESTSSQR